MSKTYAARRTLSPEYLEERKNRLESARVATAMTMSYDALSRAANSVARVLIALSGGALTTKTALRRRITVTSEDTVRSASTTSERGVADHYRAADARVSKRSRATG